MKLYNPEKPELYTMLFGLVSHIAMVIAICMSERLAGSSAMLSTIIVLAPLYFWMLHMPKVTHHVTHTAPSFSLLV